MYTGSKTTEHIQGRKVHWGLLNMKLLPLIQKVPGTKSTLCCGHTTVPCHVLLVFPLDLWWRHSWMKPGRNSHTSPGCCMQKYYRTTQQFFVVPEICFIFKTEKLNVNYFVILIFSRKHPNGLYEGFADTQHSYWLHGSKQSTFSEVNVGLCCIKFLSHLLRDLPKTVASMDLHLDTIDTKQIQRLIWA